MTSLIVGLAFVTALAAIRPVEPVAELYLEGYLSQYGQRPTDATIAYRQAVGQLPADMSQYDGVVAVENCRHIGKRANLKVMDQWFQVIVFDCLGRNVTTNWMQENNIIAEIDYYLAHQLGVVGRGGLEGRLVILDDSGSILPR